MLHSGGILNAAVSMSLVFSSERAGFDRAHTCVPGPTICALALCTHLHPNACLNSRRCSSPRVTARLRSMRLDPHVCSVPRVSFERLHADEDCCDGGPPWCLRSVLMHAFSQPTPSRGGGCHDALVVVCASSVCCCPACLRRQVTDRLEHRTLCTTLTRTTAPLGRARQASARIQGWTRRHDASTAVGGSRPAHRRRLLGKDLCDTLHAGEAIRPCARLRAPTGRRTTGTCSGSRPRACAACGHFEGSPRSPAPTPSQPFSDLWRDARRTGAPPFALSQRSETVLTPPTCSSGRPASSLALFGCCTRLQRSKGRLAARNTHPRARGACAAPWHTAQSRRACASCPGHSSLPSRASRPQPFPLRS